MSAQRLKVIPKSTPIPAEAEEVEITLADNTTVEIWPTGKFKITSPSGAINTGEISDYI